LSFRTATPIKWDLGGILNLNCLQIEKKRGKKSELRGMAEKKEP
jgi:hypothetical protein